MQPQRLSILGVGLLGGSLGLAAKSLSKDCVVMGYAHRAETRQAAMSSGVLDEVYADPVSAVRGADLVVLCTPVGILGDLLRQIAPALKPDAIVTDVGSTKREVVEAAGAINSDRKALWHFVGSHPMAGSHHRGVQYSHADLFKDALCIVTPAPTSDPVAVRFTESFWQWLGMRTIQLAPAAHDRLVADISHLPHAVAAALVTLQSPDSLALRGKGFLDSTRIAGGDAGLWRDIFLSNRDNLAGSIARLQSRLSELLAMLSAGDAQAVERWLEQAGEMRRHL